MLTKPLSRTTQYTVAEESLQLVQKLLEILSSSQAQIQLNNFKMLHIIYLGVYV